MSQRRFVVKDCGVDEEGRTNDFGEWEFWFSRGNLTGLGRRGDARRDGAGHAAGACELERRVTCFRSIIDGWCGVIQGE